MRLLVVEDEVVLADQLRRALVAEGHAVDAVHDGEEAAHLGETEPYDLIVLDIGLPKRDGLSVLRDWRKAGIDTPVLILTARDGWADRVDGLDAGADDYLPKPFHMAELSARVRALLRRRSGLANPILRAAGVELDTRSGRVLRDGVRVDLTPQELAVLSYLLHNMGRLVSRTELAEHIYQYDGDRDSNTIAVFVTRLRKKLGPDLITTVRGRGYMIDRT
ncbi:two-component system OmpR family response regulator [Albidovulum inexpectatum]|uniref:Two-component system OmpR family response regulator n=1 Tax=Albidovulum inexpectatum TaxID=196587 RepID=A0A2S5JH91_9RHOB|nr:response regulator transcription factor [Albidovulum inexpectatum]PPB80874.1 two-component system OmpR family response regulator [Albidovulum inexpectatum]